MSVCQFRIDAEKHIKLKEYCRIRNITISRLLTDYVDGVLEKDVVYYRNLLQKKREIPTFDPETGFPVEKTEK